MLTPDEIEAKAAKKYYDFLQALVRSENIFPLKVRFGKPSPTADFEKLRQEITSLTSQNFGYTIEFEILNTRRWGVQKLPSQVRFDTEEQFLSALRKTREVELFKRNIADAKTRIHGVQPWLASHVRWVLEFASDWEGVLAVCEYFLSNPRPGLYIRQLPIPVHTKFIKERSEMLSSILMEILPAAAKNPQASTFEERFGLRTLEPTIRFRALDVSVIKRLQMTDERMGLPLDRFRALPASGLRIIITENLMNLECLPHATNALGVWGQGNAAELLNRVDWLSQCEVYYWGDIDEHGYHILARLRKNYPNIRSVMMDIDTLNHFRQLTGDGQKAGAAPSNLVAEEKAAFDEIVQTNRRLEQEKIPLAFSEKVIERHISLLPNAKLNAISLPA